MTKRGGGNQEVERSKDAAQSGRSQTIGRLRRENGERFKKIVETGRSVLAEETFFPRPAAIAFARGDDPAESAKIATMVEKMTKNVNVGTSRPVSRKSFQKTAWIVNPTYPAIYILNFLSMLSITK